MEIKRLAIIESNPETAGPGVLCRTMSRANVKGGSGRSSKDLLDDGNPRPVSIHKPQRPLRCARTLVLASALLLWASPVQAAPPPEIVPLGHRIDSDGQVETVELKEQARGLLSKHEVDDLGTFLCPLPYSIMRHERCPHGWQHSRLRERERICRPPRGHERTIASHQWNSISQAPYPKARVTCVNGSLHGKATIWNYDGVVATRTEGYYYMGYRTGPQRVWTAAGWDVQGRIADERPALRKPKRRLYDSGLEFSRDLAEWQALQDLYEARLETSEKPQLIGGICANHLLDDEKVLDYTGPLSPQRRTDGAFDKVAWEVDGTFLVVELDSALSELETVRNSVYGTSAIDRARIRAAQHLVDQARKKKRVHQTALRRALQSCLEPSDAHCLLENFESGNWRWRYVNKGQGAVRECIGTYATCRQSFELDLQSEGPRPVAGRCSSSAR